MKKSRILLIVLLMMLMFTGVANAVIDTVQYPTGYFLDVDANKYNSPYYRGFGENWGWTHGAIGGTWTTATLNISAFDVDNTYGPSDGEHDLIYGWKGGVKTYIGELAGASDIWSYTTFDLTGLGWDADIAAGLQVYIDIDVVTQGSWIVTLAKSVISLDGGTLPNPNPTVPEPTTLLLLGFGLAGLATLRKKI
jgi:hypothetical protein